MKEETIERTKQSLFPLQTIGGGDCAFHALLGVWDKSKRAFICNDASLQRKKVADAIRKSRPGDSLFVYIQEAIEAIAMGRDVIVGPNLNRVVRQYSQFITRDNSEAAWDRFYIVMSKHAPVLDYIEQNLTKAEREEKQLNSIKRQFQFCLNKNRGELRAIIAENKDLYAAFQKYNQETNRDFDWKSVLKDQTVIDDYANYVQQLGNWLLPVEVKLAALVLNISVDFHTTRISSGVQKLVSIETFNPGRLSTSVRFNGINHYERMVTDEERRRYSTPSPKPEIIIKPLPAKIISSKEDVSSTPRIDIKPKVPKIPQVLEPIDIKKIEQTLQQLEEKYQLTIKQLQAKYGDAKQAYEQTTLELRTFDLERKITEEQEKLKLKEQEINAEIKAHEAQVQLLKSKIERQQVIVDEINKRKLKNLVESKITDENLDEKIKLFIERKILSSIEANESQMASVRKNVLQKLTLKNQFESRKKYQQQLEKQIQEITEEKINFEGKVQLQYEKIKKIDDNLKITTDEYNLLFQEKKVKEESEESAKNNVTKHEEKISKAIEEYQNAMRALKEKLENAKTELKTLKKATEDKPIELKSAQGELRALEETLKNEEDALQKLRDQLSNTRTMLAYCRNFIADPRFQDACFYYVRQRNQGYIPKHEETIRQLGESITAKEGTIESLKNTKIPNKKTEIKKISDEIAALGPQIEKQNTKINDINNEIQTKESAWKEEELGLNAELKRLRGLQETASHAAIKAQGECQKKLEEKNQIEVNLAHETTIRNGYQSEVKARVDLLRRYKQSLIISQAELVEIENLIEKEESSLSEFKELEKIELKLGEALDSRELEAALKAQENDDEVILAQSKAQEAERSILQAKILQLENDLKFNVARQAELASGKRQYTAHYLTELEAKNLQHLKAYQDSERDFAAGKIKYSQAFHTHLLSQAAVLTGFKDSASPVDNFIACLLQSVFNYYPLCRLDSENNSSFPEDWRKRIEKIKNKIGEFKESQALSAFEIATIIDAINEEYHGDNMAIQVTVIGMTVDASSTYLAKTPNKKIIPVTVLPQGKNYLQILADDSIANPDPYLHAHRLVMEIVGDTGISSALCLKLIHGSLGQALEKCTPIQLSNFEREFNHDILKIKDFVQINEEITKRIRSSSEIKLEAESQAALYCFRKLGDLMSEIKPSQRTALFELTRKQLFEQLKIIINDELTRRINLERKLGSVTDQQKSALESSLRDIENGMESQKQKIHEQEKVIVQKEEAVADRRAKSEALIQNYQLQSDDVQQEIAKFKQFLSAAEQQLKELAKDSSVNQAQIKKLEKEKAQAAIEVANLDKKFEELSTKIEEQKKIHLGLLKQRIDLNVEKEQFAKSRELAEEVKKKIVTKLEDLKIWRKFLKDIHERLLAHEDLFKRRSEIIPRWKQIQKESDPFLHSYEFIVSLAGLQDLASPLVKECLKSIVDTGELKEVVEDVLGDTVIELVGNKYVIRGGNISWQQLSGEIYENVVKQLAIYGISFNAQKKLIVHNCNLIGSLATWSPNLKDLIYHFIEIKYLAYAANPQPWSEKDQSYEKAVEIINSLEIDYLDVLRFLVSEIEVVVGHNLYLDEEIYLPGINLTLYSKENIHCKSPLTINTSGKPPLSFRFSKARHGFDYRVRGAADGHAGDNGKDGFGGNNAGHITIKAEKKIHHLEQIVCLANGANGMAGQDPGDGDTGRKGMPTADARATDTNGMGRAQYRLAKAKIPGMDEHGNFTRLSEFSKNGGNAGSEGLGGEGGYPGEILLEDEKIIFQYPAMNPLTTVGSEIKNMQDKFKTEAGKRGADSSHNGSGGVAGEAGTIGRDHQKIKKGFFSKTDEARGYYDEGIFANPGAFLKGDQNSGWTFCLPLFGIIRMLAVDHEPPISIDGYSGDFRRQIRLYNHFAEPGPQPAQLFDMQGRNQGIRGKHTHELDRRRRDEERLKPKANQNLAVQLTNLARLHREATHLNQNHCWFGFDKKYEQQMKELEAEEKEQSQKIEQCKKQELIKSKEITEISNTIDTLKAKLDQLEQERHHVDQLRKSASATMISSDSEKLMRLDLISQIETQRSKLQAAVSCASIDVATEETIKIKLDEVAQALQAASIASLQSQTRELAALKATHLTEINELEKLKQNYESTLLTLKQIDENDKHKQNEQELQRLQQELIHIHLEQQQEQETETVNVLANAPKERRVSGKREIRRGDKPSIRRPDFEKDVDIKTIKKFNLSLDEKEIKLVATADAKKETSSYSHLKSLLIFLEKIPLVKWSSKNIRYVFNKLPKLHHENEQALLKVQIKLLKVYASLIFKTIEKQLVETVSNLEERDSLLALIEFRLIDILASKKLAKDPIPPLLDAMDHLIQLDLEQLNKECNFTNSHSKKYELDKDTELKLNGSPSDYPILDPAKVTLDSHYYFSDSTVLERKIEAYNELGFVDLKELTQLVVAYQEAIAEIAKGFKSPLLLPNINDYLRIVLQQIKSWLLITDPELIWKDILALEKIIQLVKSLITKTHAFITSGTSGLLKQIELEIANERRFLNIFESISTLIKNMDKQQVTLILKKLKNLRRQVSTDEVDWSKALIDIEMLQDKISKGEFTITLLLTIGKQVKIFTSYSAFDKNMEGLLKTLCDESKGAEIASFESKCLKPLKRLSNHFGLLTPELRISWLTNQVEPFKKFIFYFEDYLSIQPVELNELLLIYKELSIITELFSTCLLYKNLNSNYLLPFLNLSEILDRKIHDQIAKKFLPPTSELKDKDEAYTSLSDALRVGIENRLLSMDELPVLSQIKRKLTFYQETVRASDSYSVDDKAKRILLLLESTTHNFAFSSDTFSAEFKIQLLNSVPLPKVEAEFDDGYFERLIFYFKEFGASVEYLMGQSQPYEVALEKLLSEIEKNLTLAPKTRLDEAFIQQLITQSAILIPIKYAPALAKVAMEKKSFSVAIEEFYSKLVSIYAEKKSDKEQKLSDKEFAADKIELIETIFINTIQRTGVSTSQLLETIPLIQNKYLLTFLFRSLLISGEISKISAAISHCGKDNEPPILKLSHKYIQNKILDLIKQINNNSKNSADTNLKMRHAIEELTKFNKYIMSEHCVIPICEQLNFLIELSDEVQAICVNLNSKILINQKLLDEKVSRLKDLNARVLQAQVENLKILTEKITKEPTVGSLWQSILQLVNEFSKDLMVQKTAVPTDLNISFINRALFTLQELFKGQCTISLSELKIIEKGIYETTDSLVNLATVVQGDTQKSDLWLPLFMNLQELANLIKAEYRLRVEKIFSGVDFNANPASQAIEKVHQDIIECFRSSLNLTDAYGKGNRVKLIALLLKKITVLHEMTESMTPTPIESKQSRLTQELFETIKREVHTIPVDENLSIKIEEYLIAKVNNYGLKYLRQNHLFRLKTDLAIDEKIKLPLDLNETLSRLSTLFSPGSTTDIPTILQTWIDTLRILFKAINKDGSELLSTQRVIDFLSDSRQLLNVLVLTQFAQKKNEDSELNNLMRECLYIISVLESGSDPKLLAPLEKLIIDLKYADFYQFNYLYLDEWQKNFEQYNPHHRAQLRWYELGVDTIKGLDSIFAETFEIADRNMTCADFIEQLATEQKQARSFTIKTTEEKVRQLFANTKQQHRHIDIKQADETKDKDLFNIFQACEKITSLGLKEQAFKKFHLKLKEFDLSVKENEELIDEFSENFITWYKAEAKNQSPHISIIVNQIASTIGDLYFKNILNSEHYTKEVLPISVSDLKTVFHFCSTNHRPDISLHLFFQLKKQLLMIPLDKQKMQSGLNEAVLSTLRHFTGEVIRDATKFKERFDLLVNKIINNHHDLPDAGEQLSCFIAVLPLCSPNLFLSKNCWKLIEKLQSLSKSAMPNISLLIQLGDSLVYRYASTAVFKKKNINIKDPKTASEQLLVRLFARFDSITQQAKQTAFTDTAQSKTYFVQVSQLFNILKQFQKNANDNEENFVNKLDLSFLMSLLVADESCFVGRIPKDVLQSVLTISPPNEWREKLLLRYMDHVRPLFLNSSKDITHESRFKTHFQHAFSYATKTSQIPALLDFIDLVLKDKILEDKRGKLTFENEVDLLSCVGYGADLRRLNEIYTHSSSNQKIMDCLYYKMHLALEQVINNRSNIVELETELVEIKKLTMVLGKQGLDFLRIFGNALNEHRNIHKDYLFDVLYIKNILHLLHKTQTIKRQFVLTRLSQLPFSKWLLVLQRQELTEQLGLLNSDDPDQISVIDGLFQLQKEKSKELVDKLIQKIQAVVISGKAFPLSILHYIVKNFITNRWVLDDKLLDMLSDKGEEWISKIETYCESLFVQRDRTADELIYSMRLNGSANKSLTHLLSPTKSVAESEFKLRLERIKAEFKLIEHLKEEEIQAWSDVFRKDADKKLNDPVEVDKLVAIIMRAVELSKKSSSAQRAPGEARFLPRDTQLIALLSFIDSLKNGQGRLAKISTGEGKSLIVAMLAIILVLRGDKVDIITSSPVLGERDSQGSDKLYKLFNINVSNNCDGSCKDEKERKQRYEKNQIIYGDAGSFQRDYLLTSYFGKEIRPQGLGNSCIVDETDSMFIDEAEKRLFMSHPLVDFRHLRPIFLLIWAAVNAPNQKPTLKENIEAVVQFVIEKINNQDLVVPKTLKCFIDRRLTTWVKNAYLAKRMKSGDQYTIGKEGEKYGKAIVMDKATGVEQLNTQWSNGLHQFIQLKNHEKLTDESLKAIFIANITFFKKYKGHIYGMTGTLGSEKEISLMSKNYEVDTFDMPRFREERYIQELGVVVGGKEQWIDAIIDDIHEKSQAGIKSVSKLSTEAIESKDKELQDAKIAIESLLKIKQEQFNKTIDEISQYSETLDKNNTLLQRQSDIKENDTRQGLLDECKAIEAKSESSKQSLTQLQNEIAGIEDDKLKIQLQQRNLFDVKAGKTGRAILILCDNTNAVNELKKAITAKYGDTKKVHNYDSALTKFDLKHLGPDDIVIATNIAGRGMEFDTSELLEQNGGIHVIFSYMPSNIRIEVQGFRRTARAGKKGSGKFIVQDERALNKPISIDFLRDERDEAEVKRLDEIERKGIRAIEREEMLFEKYAKFQGNIRSKLNEFYDQSDDNGKKILQLQINSLKNQWAYFLDEMAENIEDVGLVSDEKLLEAYNKFEERIQHQLHTSQFRLIDEPGELLKLGKVYTDAKAYRKAEDCYDAAIEKEPELAGFAYYYKALCIFGQSSDFGAKRRARTLLKKALDKFEYQLSLLSTANQAIFQVGKQRRSLGLGSPPDGFIQSNVGEMAVLNYHINAIKEALGSEITADDFKSGTVTGEQHDVIFKNILKEKFTGHVIKNHRVSKKASVADGKLSYKGKVIDFPKDFSFCQKEVIDLISSKVDSKSLAERVLSPQDFDQWMLTKSQFINAASGFLQTSDLIELDKDAINNATGKWDAREFKLKGHDIKKFTLELTKSMPVEQFKEEIRKITGFNQADIDGIINHLKNEKIITISHGYSLKENVKAKIKEYIETVSLRDNIADNFDSLRLNDFPDVFSGNELSIKNKLLEIIKSADKSFTQQSIGLTDDQFKFLSLLLRTKKYRRQSLLEVIGLQDKIQGINRDEVESIFLGLYERAGLTAQDLSLPETAFEKSIILWNRLKQAKIVKNPQVNFPLTEDPGKRIDQIKDFIENHIGELIPDISKDDKDKYIESVCKTLEKLTGRIKFFQNVKLDKMTLQKYKEKMPPELNEFALQACDEVLSLVEDKGFWDWNAFACAMIGIAQIVAGVILEIVSMGSLTFFSTILISEGIGDIVYAIQNGINGTFSWSAYGNYKWQSILLSVACAGIGAAVTGVTQASQISASLTSSITSSLSQTLISSCVQALLSAGIAVAVDKINQAVSEMIFSAIEGDFKNILERDAGFQSVKRQMTAQFKKLYYRHGGASAAQIVNQVVSETNKVLASDIVKTLTGKVIQLAQMVASHIGKVADQLKKSGNSAWKAFAELASLISKIAQISDVVKKVHEFICLTPSFLNHFIKNLENAYNTKSFNPGSVISADSTDNQQAAKEFSAAQLAIITDAVIEQVKNFLKQNLLQTGVQQLVQLSVDSLSNLLSGLYNDLVKQVGDENKLDEKMQEISKKAEQSDKEQAQSSERAHETDSSETIYIREPRVSSELADLLGEESNQFLNEMEGTLASVSGSALLAENSAAFFNSIPDGAAATPTIAVAGITSKFGLFGRKEPAKSPTLLTETRRDYLLSKAKSPFLRREINELYRELKPGHRKIGDGGAMDALKHEHETGELLSPEGHSQKIIERRQKLLNLLKNREEIFRKGKRRGYEPLRLRLNGGKGLEVLVPPLDAGDKELAKELLQHIEDASSTPRKFAEPLRWGNVPSGSKPTAVSQTIPKSQLRKMGLIPSFSPIKKTVTAAELATALTTPPRLATLQNGLRVAGAGLAAYGFVSAGYNVSKQYLKDKETGNYEQTGRVAAQESGCLAGGAVFGKLGAGIGTLVGGPIGSLALGFAGGIFGCYTGKESLEYVYNKKFEPSVFQDSFVK